jgi:hypothetical protein
MPQENLAPKFVQNTIQIPVRNEDLWPAGGPLLNSSTATGVSEELGTFSRAIVVESRGYTERRALYAAFSFVAHSAIIMAAWWFWPLAAPQKPFLFAMGKEFFSVPIFLPARSLHPNLPFAPNAFTNPFLAMKLAAPVRSRARLVPAVPPEEILQTAPLQVTGGLGSVLGSILSEASRPVVQPSLPLDIPPDAQVFREGGEIKPSRLIERVSFEYPQIAKLAHIFGMVVIAAVIDESGKVTGAHLVSGPGVLGFAAIEELSKERFQPTILDGQPTKCELLVRVTFRLAGWEEAGPHF